MIVIMFIVSVTSFKDADFIRRFFVVLFCFRFIVWLSNKNQTHLVGVAAALEGI